MAQAEQRLGFKPLFGAFDAAMDAFYVYDYFHSDTHNGFAAVPFSEKGVIKPISVSSMKTGCLLQGRTVYAAQTHLH